MICSSSVNSKSRGSDYYRQKLEMLISKRNKPLALHKMYPKNGAKIFPEYSKKKRPVSTDLKKAITSVGPNLQKISEIFRVNKSVVDYWISTDKDMYAFFVSQNPNRSGYIRSASRLVSIYDANYIFINHNEIDEWSFCVERTGLNPFEILMMNKCRFWDAEEELRYRLYSFAYVKKYQDQMTISFAVKRINSTINELSLYRKSKKEKILSHFEEIYGISYFEMLQTERR